MQLFLCSHCQQAVYFDNTCCNHCGALLGFDAQQLKMVALHPHQEHLTQYLDKQTQKLYQFCANQVHGVCNWVIHPDEAVLFCDACQLNRIIPNLSQPEYHRRWHKIEGAKHRLIYALLRWQLPLISKIADPERGLVFDFKADPDDEGQDRVLTGHASGVITLNIAEADDIEREMARNQMSELYRTVLGHFRHEIGHYYWDILIAPTNFLSDFRRIFGDERADYQEALQRHYEQGAPFQWWENYISAYATMHPWEDWAETWAHYLHMVDVLETANSFGLQISPQMISESNHLMHLKSYQDPYLCEDFEHIYQAWLPVTFAMNSLNRSMGQNDFYPFVITSSVKQKLAFIHQVIHHQIKINQMQLSIAG